MQQYLVFTFSLSPMTDEAADILSALLLDLGFDSFEQTPSGLAAYLPAEQADEAKSQLEVLLANWPLTDVAVTYTCAALEQRDWNEQWETEGFRPIEIDGLCVIRKPDDAEAAAVARSVPYDILVEPRMAFGSGTHATTAQLVEILLRRPLQGLRCLDMGTGTGILAICMARAGASRVVGIDIDEASVENARHNCQLNGCADVVEVLLGDAAAIEGEFDLVVANIHRNIIVADLPAYVAALAHGGRLLCSGFFADDVPVIEAAATPLGLTLAYRQERDGWVVLEFCKKKL